VPDGGRVLVDARKRPAEPGRRAAIIALAIVALVYAANAFFNHTTWGLAVRSQGGGAYVFAFFLPFGVIVPAAYIAWISSIPLAPARWLGAGIGLRDAAAVAAALAIGGLLAWGALANDLGERGGIAGAHRLFALLLVASTAEVLVFLGVLGNAVQVSVPTAHRWRAGLSALVVSSLAFGFFHFTYPAPWNSLDRALGLMLVWLPVSVLFLASRSLLGAVVLNNVMALIGFVKHRLDLAGTTTEGWLQAALACALFAAVFRLMRGRRRVA
jgi:hypothetical protein